MTKQGGSHEKAVPTPDSGSIVRQGLQRPAGRGPVRGGSVEGAQRYAKANGYIVAQEYIDEAESGRIADRPQFLKMIEEATRPNAPFHEILVWKFSRFTRKREHAVAFKSMLMKQMQLTQVLLQGSPG